MPMIERLYQHPHLPFLVGFLGRLGVILLVGHYRGPTLWENGEIATSVVEGRGFVMGITGRLEPTSWQAPGYPYLLVGVWKLLGNGWPSYLLISILQALAVSSVVYPLGWLAERWFGRQAGVVAKWMVCGLPLFAWYPTRISQVALAMSFFPWVVAGWIRLRAESPRGLVLAVGLLTGLAGLFQPMILAALGILVGILWVVALVRGNRMAAGRMLMAGFATVLVLLPWTLRNFDIHGTIVPVKNSFGKEFWMGNNPNATGSSWAPGGREEITSAFPPKCFAYREQLSEMELFGAMQAEGMEFIRSDPSAFFVRTGQKIVWFWTIAPANLVRHSLGGEAVQFRILHAGYWSLLVLLAAAGLVGAGLPREYGAVLASFFVVYSVVYGLTHVGQARYRGEMEFVLVPLAAAGIVAVASRLWRAFRAPPSDSPTGVKGSGRLPDGTGSGQDSD